MAFSCGTNLLLNIVHTGPLHGSVSITAQTERETSGRSLCFQPRKTDLMGRLILVVIGEHVLHGKSDPLQLFF